jgi:hypothetical protein
MMRDGSPRQVHFTGRRVKILIIVALAPQGGNAKIPVDGGLGRGAHFLACIVMLLYSCFMMKGQLMQAVSRPAAAEFC